MTVSSSSRILGERYSSYGPVAVLVYTTPSLCSLDQVCEHIRAGVQLLDRCMSVATTS